MRSTFSAVVRATGPSLRCRSMTTSSLLFSHNSRNLPTANTNINATGDSGSPSPNARVKPKVHNSDISGSGSDLESQLTAEQKEEVDNHNRYFAKKQTLGSLGEKADKKFWKESSKG